MNKVVGYGVSIVGLAIMAIGFNIIPLKIDFLGDIGANVLSGAGIILIIVGVVLSLKGTGGRRVKQDKEEVPIYEGRGKNRKIVGYQKN